MHDAHRQTQYQVRFDWGTEGVATVGDDADVIVIVDVLSWGTTVELLVSAGVDVASGTVAGGAGELFPDSPSAVTPEAIAGRRAVVVPEPGGAGICAGVAGHPALVVIGGFRNRSAVAQWALEQQGRKSKRFTIAVIAAGERREDGSLRMTVEDLLGAGAVIDALATLGIDYCSPEAAAAVAAYTGLRNATAHLLNASASGRQLAEEGRRADVKLATATDVSTTVPVLREFHFTA